MVFQTRIEIATSAFLIVAFYGTVVLWTKRFVYKKAKAVEFARFYLYCLIYWALYISLAYYARKSPEVSLGLIDLALLLPVVWGLSRILRNKRRANP